MLRTQYLFIDCQYFTAKRQRLIVTTLFKEQIHQFAPISFLLDVCCGTGAATQRFSSLSLHTVGLDLSAGMLEVAGSTARSSQPDAHIAYLRGDALALPFRESFDLAVCFGAFGHILPHDEPQLIRQIADVLKSGGRFVFVTSEMPSKWSKAYWWSQAFNAAMHLRNWVVKPPFIMYYLTFLLPEAKRLLEDGGFTVEVGRPFGRPLERLRLVIATRESH